MRTSLLRAFVLLMLPGLASAATFTLLGTLPGGATSVPFDLSSDGAIAVGVSDDDTSNQAFRWTGGVMTGLGTLAGDASSSGSGVSGDGAVVVGVSTNDATGPQAFRWTGGVMTGLGTLDGDSSSFALDTSANGAVVVGGSANDTGTQAFRWTGGVMTGLGTLVGETSSSAVATSADGTVVVGQSSHVGGLDSNGDPITFSQAFRWTGGLMTSLGTLAGNSSSSALDVSADGSVVVGHSDTDDGDGTFTPQAFLWTGGVMTGLGFLPDSDSSVAEAVSADGTVVVGQSGGQAFIWTAATGMQPLVSVLIAGGAPGLDFATLYDATGISGDGLWIVGKRSPSAFIASYSPSDLNLVPDPFSFAIQSGVDPSTVVVSDPATITGITGGAAAPVTVSGGEYSVGCSGVYTSAPGTINEDQTVCVRQTSAATGATNNNTFLTVGGVTGIFTSRTTGSGGGSPGGGGALDGFSLLALGLIGLLRRKFPS